MPVAADLQDEEDPSPKMILGNHRWATLVWPLIRVMVNRTTRYQLDHDADAELVSLFDLDQWEALPLTPVDQVGVCFQRSQVKEPLVKPALRRSSEIIMADLKNVADFFNVDSGRKSRSELLKTLAGVFGDESYVNSVLENDGKSGTGHGQSQEDADFLECIFSELDKNEQEEFKMVKKQIDSQRSKQKQDWWTSVLKQAQEDKEPLINVHYFF